MASKKHLDSVKICRYNNLDIVKIGERYEKGR